MTLGGISNQAVDKEPPNGIPEWKTLGGKSPRPSTLNGTVYLCPGPSSAWVGKVRGFGNLRLRPAGVEEGEYLGLEWWLMISQSQERALEIQSAGMSLRARQRSLGQQ